MSCAEHAARQKIMGPMQPGTQAQKALTAGRRPCLPGNKGLECQPDYALEA